MLLAIILCGCSDSSPNPAATDLFVGAPELSIPDRGQPDQARPDASGFTFLMGSPASEPCRYPNETQHPVTLTHAIEVLPSEVTQLQFMTAMGYNPSGIACGWDCPVENVTWHQAAAYCNALSEKNKLAECYTCAGAGADVACSEAAGFTQAGFYSCPGYRLPTEAEWEYAYRAGTTTAFYNGPVSSCTGNDPNAAAIGWYGANSGNTTHPVGKKAPNALGLYDMAGNVSEWCNDWFQADLGTEPVTDPWGAASGKTRAIRGGAWVSLFSPRELRAACRDHNTPTEQYINIGFRCVRSK